MKDRSVRDPRFSAGERVRVRAADPPGHVRVPRYCRGATGTIERVLGTFHNPERLAYGYRDDPRVLYRVRFDARSLWPDARDGHTVDVEISEHWLESAERLIPTRAVSGRSLFNWKL